MTDVVRVVWFLYPKFQVSSVQTLVPPQQQYDIGVTETDDLRRHLQEIILREDRFLIRLNPENSWLSFSQSSCGAVINDPMTAISPSLFCPRILCRRIARASIVVNVSLINN